MGTTSQISAVQEIMEQGSRGKEVPPHRHQLHKKQWNRGEGGRGYHLPEISCTVQETMEQGSKGKVVLCPRHQLFKK